MQRPQRCSPSSRGALRPQRRRPRQGGRWAQQAGRRCCWRRTPRRVLLFFCGGGDGGGDVREWVVGFVGGFGCGYIYIHTTVRGGSQHCNDQIEHRTAVRPTHMHASLLVSPPNRSNATPTQITTTQHRKKTHQCTDPTRHQPFIVF